MNHSWCSPFLFKDAIYVVDNFGFLKDPEFRRLPKKQQIKRMKCKYHPDRIAGSSEQEIAARTEKIKILQNKLESMERNHLGFFAFARFYVFTTNRLERQGISVSGERVIEQYLNVGPSRLPEEGEERTIKRSDEASRSENIDQRSAKRSKTSANKVTSTGETRFIPRAAQAPTGGRRAQQVKAKNEKPKTLLEIQAGCKECRKYRLTIGCKNPRHRSPAQQQNIDNGVIFGKNEDGTPCEKCRGRGDYCLNHERQRPPVSFLPGASGFQQSSGFPGHTSAWNPQFAGGYVPVFNIYNTMYNTTNHADNRGSHFGNSEVNIYRTDNAGAVFGNVNNTTNNVTNNHNTNNVTNNHNSTVNNGAEFDSDDSEMEFTGNNGGDGEFGDY